MGYFMYRTVITVLHIKKFYALDLKRKAAEDDETRRDAITQMIEILREERANAEATIPIVEYDSALGFEPSMEYVTDRKRIEWKLSQVDREAEKLKGML